MDTQPIVASPRIVIPRLQPLAETLYSAAELGVLQAQKYRWPEDDRGGPLFDSWLAPHIVRYEMKRELGRLGETVEDEFAIDSDLPLSGLRISFRNYSIIILKAASSSGALPSAGASEVRKSFYRQEQPSMLTAMLKVGSRDLEEHPLNLALLWVPDSRYTLRHLLVACPKSDKALRSEDGEFVAYAETHWMEQLPYPGESAEPIQPPAGPELSLPSTDAEQEADEQMDG